MERPLFLILTKFLVLVILVFLIYLRKKLFLRKSSHIQQQKITNYNVLLNISIHNSYPRGVSVIALSFLQ